MSDANPNLQDVDQDRHKSQPPSQLDRWFNFPMYLAAALFLASLAGILQLQEGINEGGRFARFCAACEWGLVLLYPLFVLEMLVHFACGSKCWKQHLIFCVIPPLRMGARDHACGDSMYFPGMGWSKVSRDLQQRLERGFSRPMMAITITILPVMGADYFWSAKIYQNLWLAALMDASFALIWMAFAFEFIVMLSVVENKVRYIKEHWIDLAVILLPLIAFLRFARMGRLMRLQQPLQQITKTTRVFRVRGALMRTYRAILMLDMLDRVLRGKPATRLARLRSQLAEKELELEEIRREIQEVEALLTPAAAPQARAAQQARAA